MSQLFLCSICGLGSIMEVLLYFVIIIVIASKKRAYSFLKAGNTPVSPLVFRVAIDGAESLPSGVPSADLPPIPFLMPFYDF